MARSDATRRGRRGYFAFGTGGSPPRVHGVRQRNKRTLPSVIEKTLVILDDEWEPPTLDTTDIACCPVRGNYWATMVFFNAGGKRWANWNREMVRTYLTGQHRLANTPYKDPKGRPQELGYWTCEDMHISHDTTGMEIITTCYVAQQLMVYYRYLPTSSREAWNAEEEKPATPVETGDVAVDLGDL